MQLSFVLLILVTAIGLTISLLPLADMCRRVSLVVWRWLITYTGPQAYPRFWHVIHGFFPLACLALAVGTWLLLAASPEMAEGVAAEPIADLTRLGTGLSMIGVFGCAMRGLHFAALRTPQAPPVSTPKRRRTSSKSAGKAVGKTRTRKSPGTQRPSASGKARRNGKASTSTKKRRQG